MRPDQLIRIDPARLLDQPVDGDAPGVGLQRLRCGCNALRRAEFVEIVVVGRDSFFSQGAIQGEGLVALGRVEIKRRILGAARALFEGSVFAAVITSRKFLTSRQDRSGPRHP